MGTLFHQRIKHPASLTEAIDHLAASIGVRVNELSIDQRLILAGTAVEWVKVEAEIDRQNTFDEQMAGFGELVRHYIEETK
jgi:hypothetical protein